MAMLFHTPTVCQRNTNCSLYLPTYKPKHIFSDQNQIKKTLKNVKPRERSPTSAQDYRDRALYLPPRVSPIANNQKEAA